MAIRFADKIGRVGLIVAPLDGASAALRGTSASAPGRTGILSAALAGASADFQGLMTGSANRTGQIATTLAGASASISGTFSQPGGAAFDFYISPTGSDSNAGTLSSPWAITAINSKQATYAGKRLGLLPGTYDVSGLMRASVGGNPQTALILNGSTNPASPTYLASSDANGFYSPRTATLDAKGASGFFGGANNIAGFVLAGGCTYGVAPAANKHNWTVDGLRIVGYSMWAIGIGNYDASSGQIQNPTVKNCELAFASSANCTVANGINVGSLMHYWSLNCLIDNNYIHDVVGPLATGDSQHYSAMYIWGSIGNPTGTSGLKITRNTIIGAGNLHQKEHYIHDSEVAYNYVDMTGSSPLPTAGQNAACISGFGPDQSVVGTLTKIHHNVLISPNMQYLDLSNDISPAGWFTPAAIYNNTMVAAGNQSSGGAAAFVFLEMSAGTRLCHWYNNLIYDAGFVVAKDFGYTLVNTDAYNVGDYNIYGTAPHYTTLTPGTQTSTEVEYSNFAAYKAAVAAEAHSLTSSVNPFSPAGTFADEYQIQVGSPAFNAGRVGGLVSGASINIGAWDGSGRPGADWVS